jgi:hypothetical protein
VSLRRFANHFGKLSESLTPTLNCAPHTLSRTFGATRSTISGGCNVYVSTNRGRSTAVATDYVVEKLIVAVESLAVSTAPIQQRLGNAWRWVRSST